MTTPSKAFRHLALILCIFAVVTAAGCSKQQKEDEVTTPNAPASDENTMGDSDSGRAMGLQTVHFSYDSFTLDSAAKNILKANAEILKSKPSVRVQVEGHCDQRGGVQYNIALGEKRANAAKKYLIDLGVGGDRITTISYGKEKLLDTGDSEEAHARNRRANFVVTAQ